ncbi:hypothetical protein KZI27_08530 [Curtobacterium sp. TC1]|uniref:hypothetical protein n=1 Tax=Curtobacterium sp. TC1 TaxID=2862880 RepID=UPI001C9AD0C6|nr:hypothetical protein [Curtobacterium sp. TC1]QZQ56832.1 hypothetical protein KZI27_08530 [Curtobacterium sp. TC1]
MGLIATRRRRRSLIWVGACAVAVAATGCGAPDPTTTRTPRTTTTVRPATESARIIETVSQQRLADVLIAGLPCEDRDDYQDDLTFWDSMRGYDCVDAADTVSVRVYGSSRSVDQILPSWADALVDGRGARRGVNWFVVGPRDLISQVDPPREDPEVRSSSTSAPAPTAQQEFLTNCSQYTFDEAVRAIRGERVTETDGAYYDRAFSGVGEAVRASLDQRDLALLRAEDDEARWPSMLSERGPAWKQVCLTAMSRHDDLLRSGARD